nr:hypothetical protein [Tanacetum cinerariifolium]
MSAIADVKCVLSHKAFDAFCEKFYILEEKHPILPNRGDTMHERPTGKIGLYTRFFYLANFRLSFSTFLVDIFKHFRINISQLSVIRAAKVFHFEILCRVYEIVPPVGLFRCFYVNSKKSEWISFGKRFDNASVCGNQKEQGDPVCGGGGRQGVNIQQIVEVTDAAIKDVALAHPKCQRKRKTMVTNAGGSLHNPKKLRDDHRTPSGHFVIAVKFISAVHRLFAIAELNAKARVNSLVMSSSPIMTAVTTTTSMADPAVVVKEKTTKPSLFASDSSSTGGADPNASLEKFQDDEMKVVNDKFETLYTDFVEMTLYLEERFYPHLLTTISCRRWLIVHGMKLVVIKCQNSPEYIFALRAAIGKAIEKGIQDGLAVGITYGKEGTKLTDVAAHNPSAEVDYVSTLRAPRSLRDVFIPLAESLSVTALTGIEGASNTMDATSDPIMALSATFTSACIVAPIRNKK